MGGSTVYTILACCARYVLCRLTKVHACDASLFSTTKPGISGLSEFLALAVWYLLCIIATVSIWLESFAATNQAVQCSDGPSAGHRGHGPPPPFLSYTSSST